VALKALAPPETIVKFVLFVLALMMHPVVDAVHAPHVTLAIEIVPANVVMVHVVPPTQVPASSVTSSPEPGADAPVVPPLTVDHIAVDELSQVQVVLQTAKRDAA
jgi:hypothetical protein